jgi:multicomponent Na+:H+ antiporter subunit F
VTIFQTTMAALMGAAALSTVLAAVRLLRGPSIPDRAMAFDLIMTHFVALVAIYAVIVGQESLLDAIIIVAVLGFLGTVALARYIEEGRS